VVDLLRAHSNVLFALILGIKLLGISYGWVVNSSPHELGLEPSSVLTGRDKDYKEEKTSGGSGGQGTIIQRTLLSSLKSTVHLPSPVTSPSPVSRSLLESSRLFSCCSDLPLS